ncbi:MAG: Gfo/Idh/MocA family oxidoreductase [Gammaproteobacteria bacterium]|jgi:predicted dehydrogenase|nr:Gfo/Idh/MocA family oxidoreductase [Gammaproteobacteria bacterium]
MRKYGLAIIGASKRSTMMLDYLNNHPQQGFVAGIYDIIPAAAEYLIKHYSLADATVYGSLVQAMDDPHVHVVFIGTPDCEHVAPTITGLRAGKHVYCEKPIATTVQDCDRIIEEARNTKSLFYLGMNLRHSPVYETLHKALSDGRFGKLLTLEANELYYSGKTYFRRWNRLRKYSGGLWITKACHDFDLLNWFAGGKPTRVFATSSLSHYKPMPEAGEYCRVCSIKDQCPDRYSDNNPIWDKLAQLTEEATGQRKDICLFNSDKDTFDNGIAVVDYDNDVRACYVLSVVSSRSTRQMSLVGTEGSAQGDMEDCMVTFWKRHSEQRESSDLHEQMNSGHGGADERILADFFHCCQTGEKPRSSWADGRESLIVGLAARESCDTGKPVILRE